ncbi:MAG: type II secretion system protein [Armatimonadetes bacterium]|nr:type II secretion system protein [Armatimonadota bacterium]
MKPLTRKGFTLVEILICIAILSLLAAVIFAAAGPARESARQRVCVSNLHQIGLATAMYIADYDGVEVVKGSPITFSQAGLPVGSKGLEVFFNSYLKDAQLRICPDWRHDSGTSDGYFWGLVGDDPQYPDTARDLDAVLSERGQDYILAGCINHNVAKDTDDLPRWVQKRIIVLRLSQKIDNKLIPLHDRSAIAW